ncbi:MAG: cell wall hydrolase [Hyphomicrobiales bacterium]|nr:MAG: cell wall hydrolase [Hyphomicrobiales bacterium]
MGLFGSIESWARPRHSLAGVFATLVLSLAAYPMLTAGAHAPADGDTLLLARGPVATLTRAGGEVIITGSVESLFNTGFFAGPNRAEKVNRARLTPDGETVSGGFEAIRVAIAEARAPKRAKGELEAIDTIQTASIDPATSAAIAAIDQVVPMPPSIMPVSAPLAVAYARETTPATAFDLLVDKSGKKVSEKELWCMATAIYFEARGESYRGQVAVGQVVMNRVAHKIYPKTICNVVFQNQHMRNACQFSFACDGIPETVTEPKAWAQAEEIATGVINGSLFLTEVGASTHYHATYVYPHWAPKLKKNTKIGQHIFYQFKRGWTAG